MVAKFAFGDCGDFPAGLYQQNTVSFHPPNRPFCSPIVSAGRPPCPRGFPRGPGWFPPGSELCLVRTIVVKLRFPLCLRLDVTRSRLMCWECRYSRPAHFPEGRSPGTGVTGKASRRLDPRCPPPMITSRQMFLWRKPHLQPLCCHRPPPPHIPVTKLSFYMQCMLTFQRNEKATV